MRRTFEATHRSSATACPECGARYLDASDSCAARFDALLALDHSRREPWGSRHGQAFAAFALQHPMQHASSLEVAWVALWRIYMDGAGATDVFASLRASRGEIPPAWRVPKRPLSRVRAPEVTIADLADFDAETYADRLDSWCRATLASWGIALEDRGA